MGRRGEWEVLDFGDAVIHVFTAEQREYYDLESFYGAAEEVRLSRKARLPCHCPLVWETPDAPHPPCDSWATL